MGQPLLSIQHIGKQKSDSSGQWLFRNITASVERGDRIALLGASGTGKSTLLRIVSRLDSEDEGELLLEGLPKQRCTPQEWRKKVCYVAQLPVMLPGTVEQNLRTVSELHRLPFDQELARRFMAEAGLGGMDWQKLAADLSGGEKQRVALVRSLLLRPSLLLLDESTSSLDPASKDAVEQMINRWLAEEGAAALWITHDMEQSLSVSDQIWFMGEGMLLERSGTKVFFEGPATEQAQRFIQRPDNRGGMADE
ncbi:ATP-binding cassette domain-containing protein [Paenibacillus sp. NPDC058071]|uniref:ABC transporter ATP-binding protein n=1 Tax=Paenibacillus sp. NPDC058071 TaxID=3346326 RepID=UPI0036DBB45F